LSPGYDSDFDLQSNDYYIEDSLELEKRTKQREFAKKMEYYSMN